MKACKVFCRIIIFTVLLVAIYLIATNSYEIVDAILSIPWTWAICYLLGCVTACIACNWNALFYEEKNPEESNTFDSDDHSIVLNDLEEDNSHKEVTASELAAMIKEAEEAKMERR